MADKTTLSFSPSERDQLQQLAAQLGIMATRGAGARTLGSLSGFLNTINDAYSDDPARTLTLLARLLQRQRPDLWGYWVIDNKRFLVRWTAQPPRSKRGEAAMVLAATSMEDYPSRTPNASDQYLVPDVVTDKDVQWLQQSGVTVQREEVPDAVLA